MSAWKSGVMTHPHLLSLHLFSPSVPTLVVNRSSAQRLQSEGTTALSSIGEYLTIGSGNEQSYHRLRNAPFVFLRMKLPCVSSTEYY